jgi:hypothetical protein
MLSLAVVASAWAAEAVPQEAKVIADIKKLGGFVELDEISPEKSVIGVSLKNTKVTNAWLEELKGLPNLRALSLSHTKVTNAGLKHLKGLAKLQYLDLSSTKVTSSGLEHLKGLENLRYLDVRRTKVVEVKDLERALPECIVMYSK